MQIFTCIVANPWWAGSSPLVSLVYAIHEFCHYRPYTSSGVLGRPHTGRRYYSVCTFAGIARCFFWPISWVTVFIPLLLIYISAGVLGRANHGRLYHSDIAGFVFQQISWATVLGESCVCNIWRVASLRYICPCILGRCDTRSLNCGVCRHRRIVGRQAGSLSLARLVGAVSLKCHIYSCMSIGVLGRADPGRLYRGAHIHAGGHRGHKGGRQDWGPEKEPRWAALGFSLKLDCLLELHYLRAVLNSIMCAFLSWIKL